METTDNTRRGHALPEDWLDRAAQRIAAKDSTERLASGLVIAFFLTLALAVGWVAKAMQQQCPALTETTPASTPPAAAQPVGRNPQQSRPPVSGTGQDGALLPASAPSPACEVGKRGACRVELTATEGARRG